MGAPPIAIVIVGVVIVHPRHAINRHPRHDNLRGAPDEIWWQLLDRTQVHGQDDVDRVFVRTAGGSAGAVGLPKGMSAETALLVQEALRSSEVTLSATEVAEVVGVSRVSARRYLEHFVTTGQADVRLRYGSTGRPERRYRWVG